MSTPSASAARISSGVLVSTDTGTPSRSAPSTTGNTRAISSAAPGATAPGRVDSPPMSRMSAPSATSRSHQASAAAVPACRPPSEKESGVTLTMPITRGRVRSMR